MSLFETQQIYKVSELTKLIKHLLEESPLRSLWVEGEVSNFKQSSSGHFYFTLKDASSQIECVMYKSTASRLRFMPDNGISIIIQGNLTVYEPRGTYQITVNRVEPVGLGALQLAFEQLKQRLAAEGLFDEAHKKPLPLLPRKIGVITSPTGAAIRDIINIVSRRFYNVSILIHPVAVQGVGAAEEIAAAIATMNEIDGLDVLIVGRGGGSIEDLWAFNEEILARSIYASKIPVISAVGHEIDFTIADFVADYRAPTPSAAAEIVIPSKIELKRNLDNFKIRMYSSMESWMKLLEKRLKNFQNQLLGKDIRNRIHSFQQDIDYLLMNAYNVLKGFIGQKRRSLESYQGKLAYAGMLEKSNMRHKILNLEQQCITNIQHLLESKKEKFGISIAKLNAFNPLSVLQRGYSLCLRHSTKETIRNAAEVSVGEELEIKLSNGEIICEVKHLLIRNENGT